jgi:hypothetical protein
MKPQEFFIGLRDFFSVVVPGVVFLCLQPFEATRLLQSGDVERTLVLVIAAYLLGSIAAALGAGLDWAVDPLIEHPSRKQWFGGRLEDRREAAEALRLELLEGCSAPLRSAADIEQTKGFWWDHLRLNSDVAIAELDRLEASQKLFRSLVATFALLAVAYAIPFGGSEPKAQEAGSEANWRDLAHWIFGIASLLSAILYAGRRYLFLTTLYRLAGAYRLKGCAGERAS